MKKIKIIKFINKKNYKIIFNMGITIIGITLLSGCTFRQNNASADIQIQAARYLNPDIYGKAAPVVLTIFQLKSPFSFKQANYAALSQNSAQTLGRDLIDKTSTEVRPASNKQINIPLSPDTQYLGIMAAYRNVNNAVWHKAIKINSGKNKTVIVNIDLESQQLGVTASNKKRWLF